VEQVMTPEMVHFHEILHSIQSGTGNGTLSDRLNPDHPHFDALLKNHWKNIPKKQRTILVEADQKVICDIRQQGEENLNRLPFVNEPDDHCESPPEAYRDVVGFLDLIAKKIGKTRESLKIYDPYFCAGAMKKHLCALGFSQVYNECEDFYERLRTKNLPPHDVVVTNPPYSQDHVEKLLKFCGEHDKPYMLLMPSYVCGKPYFYPLLAAAEYKPSAGPKSSTVQTYRKKGPIFAYPPKRYNYWTPKSMRSKSSVQGHASSLGHRTSPFVSFWYIDLEPVCTANEVLEVGNRPSSTLICCETIQQLPKAVKPASSSA
jgi:hypothetical protein